MNRGLEGLLVAGIVAASCLLTMKLCEPKPVDAQACATTEQLVIVHYIKNNWPEAGNEIAMEHYDGIITQEDYWQILGRVQQQINRKGLSHFYGQRNPE